MHILSIYTSSKNVLCISNRKIPLSKGRDDKRILYITGIALQLAKYENLPAMEIADAIASHLSAESDDIFSVQIISPGWIHLELAHPVLAAWLQKLISLTQELEEGVWRSGESKVNQPSITNGLFTVQYAHARCCSLVRLAECEGLISSSHSIPWLNREQKLRLNHLVELRLISELVQVVDELQCSASGSSVKWEKAALCLSQAFDNFWRSCRIWGEVKATLPELAQARLGLVMATQSVLRFLLEEKLGIFAPLEL